MHVEFFGVPVQHLDAKSPLDKSNDQINDLIPGGAVHKMHHCILTVRKYFQEKPGTKFKRNKKKPAVL